MSNGYIMTRKKELFERSSKKALHGQSSRLFIELCDGTDFVRHISVAKDSKREPS